MTRQPSHYRQDGTCACTPPTFTCDPAQHDGEHVPAQFLLRVKNRPVFSRRPVAFATCPEHIAAGYDTLDPTTDETVTVERIAHPAEATQ